MRCKICLLLLQFARLVNVQIHVCFWGKALVERQWENVAPILDSCPGLKGPLWPPTTRTKKLFVKRQYRFPQSVHGGESFVDGWASFKNPGSA